MRCNAPPHPAVGQGSGNAALKPRLRRVLCRLWPLIAGLTFAAIDARAQTSAEVIACVDAGWQHETLIMDSRLRSFLWRAPPGAWRQGALLILHGGGGYAHQWCHPQHPVLISQVQFAQQALDAGFAVFLLQSATDVRDREGRLCGQVWDDEVRARRNLDLPYLDYIMHKLIPAIRPRASAHALFMTGLSSGGYMALRAATHFPASLTAVAPVSSGNPYGWHRQCVPGPNDRDNVHGAGYDNETGLPISVPQACAAQSFAQERPWDGVSSDIKASFLMLHHRHDGINDYSCHLKAVRRLRDHGHEVVTAVLQGVPIRSLRNHLWFSAYNQPILLHMMQRSNRHKAATFAPQLRDD